MEAPEQEQPSTDAVGLNKGAVLVLALVVFGAVSLVISSLPDPPAPEAPTQAHIESPDAPIEQVVQVDESGLVYSWIDVKIGLQSARHLRHIPRAKLGAVQLWHEGWTRKHPDKIYIANLLHAVPGEEVTATLHTRRYFHAAAHAGDIGEVHGMLTEFLASEIAAFSPDSDRQQASREAAKAFEGVEKVRPKSYDEVFEQMLKYRQRQRRQPPPREGVSRETTPEP